MENKTESTKSEVENKPEPKPEDISILINKATVHINNVKEYVLKWTGKPNHNPYLWLKNKGFTLAESMVKNPENYKPIDLKITLTNILSIKAEAPLVMSSSIIDRKELNAELEAKKQVELEKAKDKLKK